MAGAKGRRRSLPAKASPRVVEVKGLFDTNILIDYLAGIDEARRELALYRSSLISVITWMEVLVGAADDEEERALRSFLSKFRLLEVDQAIGELAVSLRRRRKIRLPDAVIWATAQANDALLVTRNTKSFPEGAPGVRVPYRI